MPSGAFWVIRWRSGWIGDRHIRLLAKPILDAQGQTMGRVTHWVDRTEELASEQRAGSDRCYCSQSR